MGIYFVVVMDVNNCLVSFNNINILSNFDLIIISLSLVYILNEGGIGVINVIVFGGIGFGIFSYFWIGLSGFNFNMEDINNFVNIGEYCL